jgi:hypothetical protein
MVAGSAVCAYAPSDCGGIGEGEDYKLPEGLVGFL